MDHKFSNCKHKPQFYAVSACNKGLKDRSITQRYGNAEVREKEARSLAFQAPMFTTQAPKLRLNTQSVCPCVEPERSRRANLTRPDQEYIEFLRSKPIVSTKDLFDSEHKLEGKPKTPFHSYGINHLYDQNPMYRTTAQDYGYDPPAEYHVPKRNFTRSQAFSNSQFPFGMYRDGRLNDHLDTLYE